MRNGLAAAGTAAVFIALLASASGAQATSMVECGSGQVCIYPQTNFRGVPYVRRASDGSVNLKDTVINDKTYSVINNGTGKRTARIYRAPNYTGSYTCIQPGGRIADLEGFAVGRWGSSLKLNNDRCG